MSDPGSGRGDREREVKPTYHERPAESYATDVEALVEVMRSALHFLEDLHVGLDQAVRDGALGWRVTSAEGKRERRGE